MELSYAIIFGLGIAVIGTAVILAMQYLWQRYLGGRSAVGCCHHVGLRCAVCDQVIHADDRHWSAMDRRTGEEVLICLPCIRRVLEVKP